MSNEIEYERTLSRDEIADRLEGFAAALRGNEPFSLKLGGQTVTLGPPGNVEFEIEVEDESSLLGRGERSVEFELEWKKTDDDGELP